MDFVQTSKIFILEFIYMYDISRRDLWSILCPRSLSNYAPSVMALLNCSSWIPLRRASTSKWSMPCNHSRFISWCSKCTRKWKRLLLASRAEALVPLKVIVPFPSKMMSKLMIFFSEHALQSIFSGLLKSNLQGSSSHCTIAGIPTYHQFNYYNSFSC